MLRTHTCGELTEKEIGMKVSLCGWVRAIRDHGGIQFFDICDRYGLTQIVIYPEIILNKIIKKEYVLKVTGLVRERTKGTENQRIVTGKIEVLVEKVEILNESLTPPFELISEKGKFLLGEDVRLKFRYLDLRRDEMMKNISIRDKTIKVVRKYFQENNFFELETPILVKSTPEGARDFLVPSRANPGKFYALPQSPQLYKQLLMISGFDRYYQIAKCFRDEDLRADRQPEFTQIDVEMSFIEKEDIFSLIENLIKKIWKEVLNVEIQTPFPKLSYEESIEKYGTDKPDIAFGYLRNVTLLVKNSNYEVFKSGIEKGGIVQCMAVKNAENLWEDICTECGEKMVFESRQSPPVCRNDEILCQNYNKPVSHSQTKYCEICGEELVYEERKKVYFCKNKRAKCVNYGKCGTKLVTEKRMKKLIEWAKANIGIKGFTWLIATDLGLRSIPESIARDGFSSELQKELVKFMNVQKGDMLIFIADKPKINRNWTIEEALLKIREELIKNCSYFKYSYRFIWIVDFPLFKYSLKRLQSVHHPFTKPKDETIKYLDEDPAKVKSEAYDLVLNGIELGGGSIRIHKAQLQQKIFKILGMNDKEIKERFGFLISALKYGAPPHGGIALGLDRLVAVLTGAKSIKEVILFPKNKKFISLVDGSPSEVSKEQLKELNIISFKTK